MYAIKVTLKEGDFVFYNEIVPTIGLFPYLCPCELYYNLFTLISERSR